MSVFWIVAASFVAGALLFVLPPLWRPPVPRAGGAQLAVYRDQWREVDDDLANDLIAPEALDQARTELRRRAAEEAGALPALPAAARHPRLAWALALLLPLASAATYVALGDPQAAAPPAAPAAAAPGMARHSVTPAQIQAMVAGLAERLKREPGDAEGWAMLGRSYTALGRYRDAATALGRAGQIVPDNPALLADLADVLGMAQGKRLAGEPARLIQKALDIDPRHAKALALAGSVAFEARDYGAARGYWERLIAVLPPGSESARSVQGSIAEARQLDGDAAVATAAAPAPAASAGAASVAGRITLSAALRARVGAGDTLFVFARAAEGPRLPLAILKRPVGAWPSEFVLDDSMAMSPEWRLSGQSRVVIGARVSRSGNATPQPGDLAGQSAPVAPGAAGVELVIDQQLQQ